MIKYRPDLDQDCERKIGLGGRCITNSVFSVAAGDLDGNGVLDLAVANANSNNVSVLLNNGDGTF